MRFEKSPEIIAGVVFVAIVFVGCGSRTGFQVDEEADDAGTVVEECALPGTVRGVVGRGDEDACELEGRGADGRTHLMRCAASGRFPDRTFEGCQWIVDGVTVCECHEPDWANTCPGGIPICLGWNRPFDFASDVAFEP